jgi:transposase
LVKSEFQLHGINSLGGIALRKRLRRHQMVSFFAQFSPCLVGIVAGSGMHYWARIYLRWGITARAMGLQFVRPYLQSALKLHTAVYSRGSKYCLEYPLKDSPTN